MAASKEDVVRIVLSGADITCSDGAAIYAVQSKKTILTLADNTDNKITDGESYAAADEANTPNAAIFAQDDLTINGSGNLAVNGNYERGIATKDNLVITGGNIIVTAVNDGLRGRDSIEIAKSYEGMESASIIVNGGIIKVTSSDDGFNASDGSGEVPQGSVPNVEL